MLPCNLIIKVYKPTLDRMVTEPSVLEYLMLPRLAAVAEAGWTPQEKRNYEDFKERIRKDAELYDLKGWNYGKHIMK